MSINIKFTPVFYCLVEPNLKLLLAPGRRDFDGPSQTVELFYDPYIAPDQFTIPFPEARKKLWSMINSNPPPPELPFISYKSQKVLSFFVKFQKEAGLLKIIMPHGEHGLTLKAAILGKTNIVENNKLNNYDIIFHVLNDIIKLPAWDEEAGVRNSIQHGNIKRIAFYIERATAKEISDNSSFSVDFSDEAEVLLAERAVAIS